MSSSRGGTYKLLTVLKLVTRPGVDKVKPKVWFKYSFFCWTSRGGHSEPFLLFEFLCGTPPSCLKVMGGGGGGVVVAYEILVSAQGPLVLGFWGLGLRVWGLGVTIFKIKSCVKDPSVAKSKQKNRYNI